MTPRSDHPTDQSAQFWRPRPSLRDDLVIGLRWGIGLAAVFSALMLVIAIVRGSTVYERYDGLTTWQVISYYFGAGAAGGAFFGLLRPIQHRYVGKFITAYLILFLVYGGGTAVFLPASSEDPPLSSLLKWGAVLCLVLAPVYVRITRGWRI